MKSNIYQEVVVQYRTTKEVFCEDIPPEEQFSKQLHLLETSRANESYIQQLYKVKQMKKTANSFGVT